MFQQKQAILSLAYTTLNEYRLQAIFLRRTLLFLFSHVKPSRAFFEPKTYAERIETMSQKRQVVEKMFQSLLLKNDFISYAHY